MSHTCPSSSHQLVAAAFRRARKKFPTNFGLIPWPLHERKDSKSEQSQSSMCQRCERCCASSEIRNVRSSNVWPQFASSSWSSDPRGTRSTRENLPHPRRRKVGRSCGGCDCRRICGFAKRNAAVSFNEVGDSNSRCSGGNAAVGRSSIETMSNRSCRSRGRRNDCGSIERVDNMPGDTRNWNEKKSRSRHRSCIRDEARSMDLGKINCLNLLYDRDCRTRNSVSFSSNGGKPVINNSEVGEEAGLDFPRKLHEWEYRAREDTIGTGSRPRGIQDPDEIIVNRSCAGKCGQFENVNYRARGHHDDRRSFERNHDLHESSLGQDLRLRAAGSRASSTNETNRLCRDCARENCTRNSTVVASLPETADDLEGRCNARGDDVCAIKHKDSMAILVEKFKNKKDSDSCTDDEMIFKFDEDASSRGGARNDEKKIRRCDRQESEEFEREDFGCCKNHGETGAWCGNSKILKPQSEYCCSAREGSCRNAL